MTIPLLPESAPFTPAQRAWLNGFFAGVLGLSQAPANGAARNGAAVNGVARAPAPAAPPAAEEAFPWHDPALPMTERLQLAEGKPRERVLMAAMAQLDCGACGYLCKTYGEAIARGDETDLTKCAPGGKDTARKLKELVTVAPQAGPAPQGADAPRSPAPVGVNGHTPKPVAAQPAPRVYVYDRKHPFPAEVLQVSPLTRDGSAKDVRFVSLNLHGSGLTYEVGDALGVFPENCAELASALLDALGAEGVEPVITPDGRVVPVREALANDYAITKGSIPFLSALANAAADAAEAEQLRRLAEDDRDGYLDGHDVLDLLERFPSARPPVADAVAALPPIQPRLYSIASSPKAHPGEVHLTVGVVRYLHKERTRKGVASTFLAGLRPGQRVRVFVHPSPGFRPPTAGDAPMIMVGPGTGIAPFRAFLAERKAVGAKGKNWLFFGDQRRACDFFYQEEVEAHLRDGVLTRLDTAFSRDQEEKVYVQHRMLENAAEIWAWLQEGAHFYVCGDARRMALDVDRTLQTIVMQQGNRSADEAKRYVRELTRAKRYQRDVY